MFALAVLSKKIRAYSEDVHLLGADNGECRDNAGVIAAFTIVSQDRAVVEMLATRIGAVKENGGARNE